MKIRRLLATAVAAAVTTPVVFLSAAPAFADTKPTPASTQKPAPGEEDEKPSLEELEKAVDAAEAKVAELEAKRKVLVDELRAMKLDEALAAEVDASKKALGEAEAAKKTADATLATAEEMLTKAKEALAKLPETAVEQEKTAAEKAVTDAEKAVTDAKAGAEQAAATQTAAELRHKKAEAATTPFYDARFALAQKIGGIDADLVVAREELAEAEEALEGLEELPFDCEEDRAVVVDVAGPKEVAVGTSAVFSLTVENTSDRTLDAVEAVAFAMHLPTDWEEILEEEKPKQFITVEWTGAGNPHWSPVTEEFDAIEVGSIAKGKKADLKLRLTLDPKTPVGKGVAFANGSYENEDGSCGISEQHSNAYFDIVAAKTDKPKPEPTPSETTATPTPAPTTGGNGNTTQQGGSSDTPVRGSLAATGAHENLTQLGLTAAATVALGAGALVIARRRKAGTNA
ncbi:peptidase [Streptomyces sp. NPDC006553]|uniref:peptidase n=1 Tax=unclassified Streptomyces TaxID=2593676 RepID=UPI0022549154|nr:peptidase [Streptomyces sp. NBC_00233]MCX5227967.1 peptidase [Streptomyces sp. NBC_00233]